MQGVPRSGGGLGRPGRGHGQGFFLLQYGPITASQGLPHLLLNSSNGHLMTAVGRIEFAIVEQGDHVSSSLNL